MIIRVIRGQIFFFVSSIAYGLNSYKKILNALENFFYVEYIYEMKIIKNWKLIVFIVLILAITFLIFLNIKQNRQIFELEESRTNLLKGERIDYFDLVGTDNRRVDISALNDGKPHLIFIPKQPCLGCNPCLAYWKRFAQILKNEVAPSNELCSDHFIHEQPGGVHQDRESGWRRLFLYLAKNKGVQKNQC